MKQRYFFISYPAYGHVLTLYSLALEFADTTQIYFAVHKRYTGILTSHPNITFYYYEDFEAETLGNVNIIAATQSVVQIADMLTQNLLDTLQEIQPDVVFADQISLWGHVAAKRYGKPYVTVATTIQVNPRKLITIPIGTIAFGIQTMLNIVAFRQVAKQITQYAKKYQVPDITFTKLPYLQGDLLIICASKNMQHYMSPVSGETVSFYYPIINSKSAVRDISVTKPVVLISFSTVYRPEESYILTIARIFVKEGWHVIISSGGITYEAIQSTENIEVYQFINQPEMIKKVDVVVFSGGLGTLRNAIMHHIPMIVIPRIIEQVVQTRIITQEKIGLHIRYNYLRNGWYTKRMIQKFITRLHKYKNNLRRFSDEQSYDSFEDIKEQVVRLI